MSSEQAKSSVLVCDQQPIAVEGLRWILNQAESLHFAGGVHSLEALAELVNSTHPGIALIDKGFGVGRIVEWLHNYSRTGGRSAPVVWGPTVSENEALRFLQAGARGILKRTADPEVLLACLNSVLRGETWMEEGILCDPAKLLELRKSHLTTREQQVAELVEQGLRNSDIARELGIRTGTVKIHLRHIFEKTGVRGREGLALQSLRGRGLLAAPALA